jgi:hypothetical protein
LGRVNLAFLRRSWRDMRNKISSKEFEIEMGNEGAFGKEKEKKRGVTEE